jgi:hypothetical protein
MSLLKMLSLFLDDTVGSAPDQCVQTECSSRQRFFSVFGMCVYVRYMYPGNMK